MSKTKCEKNVKRAEQLVFGQAIQALLANKYQDIRKVIHSVGTAEYVRSYHNYAALCQKHQRKWCETRTVTPGLSILGILCIEAMKKAIDDVPWPRIWAALEHAVEEIPSKRPKPFTPLVPHD